ncbi:hypothetical protein R2601_04548 [Salipiger bermudensis HTCC2601]|uniref:Uncharacterized protein n=1 Tax=Salipiger bermudensis (strain DSM 26914 / JCM 13377 / KCTC 12554 / HTCC2601) TaxID=314265 RepID=Q0FVT6_SALBH|nr:hypothetical protein R2601_04548 [Salipiger bermudensis HTCC2601]
MASIWPSGLPPEATHCRPVTSPVTVQPSRSVSKVETISAGAETLTSTVAVSVPPLPSLTV